ncbi:competence/damage-inducible protein A [Ornithinibacillus contaminans]|uniref:competence/damage-inducible protein A n=1 Tax=Ornithinibacillus contaminans TaxID=694055 RepID=UPI00064D7315|nr:competence/damage-inducible protein A [Ornithinibacillus contaminans]
MKQVNAEIIAVGTELLLGQIANTNAQWISEQLALHGINVFYHGVVGDNQKRVADSFQLAQTRSDVVIVTGGLGPTDDDLTREAFQLISGLNVVEHGPSMEKIEAYFSRQNTVMTPNNRKQARVFSGSTVIMNEVGMAPGMIVEHDQTIWVFLPGVPREMKSLMREGVLPILSQKLDQHHVIRSYVLRFIGIGESKLEHELKELIDKQDNPTIAPLAQSDGVVIRLTAKALSDKQANLLLDQTKDAILAKVGEFYYGMNEETIQHRIVSLLRSQQCQIASAESLTGGKFIEKLISVPGASQVCKGSIVCYDASVKREVLHVSNEIIDQFGTVSEECAQEMAKNVADLLQASIGISFTGVAGPDPIEGKPVGTVYIGVYRDGEDSIVRKYEFLGDRETIRQRAALKGYELLYSLLKG